MRVRKGEIHWANLDPVMGSEQGGMRPVLILQADAVNRHANTTVVLAITSRPQRVGYPLVIRLEPGEGGLPKASWVKLNQLRTLSLERLRGSLGQLSAQRMQELERALLEVLDIH